MKNLAHPDRHKRPYLRHTFRVLPEKGQDSFILLISSDINRHRNNISILTKAGCRFLGENNSKSGFQCVLVPIGWKKVANQVPRYMCLLDAEGRKQIEMLSIHTGSECKVFVRRVRQFRLF